MDSRDFISAIAQFFQQPRRLVLGNETAEEAGKRFSDAVDDQMESTAADKDVAIVTHGTVISLLRSTARNGPLHPLAADGAAVADRVRIANL